MRKVLIIGATSAIAEATARLFAQDGDRLYLVARDRAKLTAASEDFRVRGAHRVEYEVLDANELDHHGAMLARAEASLDGMDIVLIAHGTLPDQAECQKSVPLMLRELQTNCISTLSLLTLLANRFEAQRRGTIAVISSVAGDRGRQSNYVYGTAKGALSIFLQGLRHRLHANGVRVLTVKPGFVDTPMTASFRKGLLWAKPHSVARRIYRAILSGQRVVYVPSFWRFIMTMIKAIPEPLFIRTKL